MKHTVRQWILINYPQMHVISQCSFIVNQKVQIVLNRWVQNDSAGCNISSPLLLRTDEDGLSLHINQCMNRGREWFALCEQWRHPVEIWMWGEKNGGKQFWKKEMSCRMWTAPLTPQHMNEFVFLYQHNITLQNSIQHTHCVPNCTIGKPTHSDGLHYAHVPRKLKSIKVKQNSASISVGICM